MVIYSYKGNYKDKKDALFEKAWDLESLGKPLPSIMRDDKGKPFFDDNSCYFSISHSREYWVCVFSKNQVGIDIQYRKSFGNELLIARRFFSNEDALMVESKGTDSFYELWTRREALGKFLGTGFFIPHQIEHFYIIKDFTIEERYQGAIAMEKEEEIWIKTIN